MEKKIFIYIEAVAKLSAAVWHKFCSLYGLFFAVMAVVGMAYGEDLLPPMNGNASDFAERRVGSVVNASIKIIVSDEGLYKISRAELLAAGIDSALLEGNNLRLFNRIGEVAIYVSTDGVFSDSDFLIFFAEPYKSLYTEKNVYWLGFGVGGLRMTERSGALIPGGTAVSTYRHTSVHDPDQMYFNNFMPNDSSFDHWFTAFMSEGGYNINNIFSVWSGGRIISGSVVVELSLHGGDSYAGSNDHRTTVKINGTVVGSLVFDGYDAYTGQLSFSPNLLGAATTSVQLNQTYTANANDRAYLSSFSLEFTRLLDCLSENLLFSSWQSGECNYTVTGYSTSNVFYVVDISDPVLPVLLNDYVVSSSGGVYSVTFGDDTDISSKYEVAEEAGLQVVDSIEHIVIRNLVDTDRQADYILICPYSFRTSAYRLLKQRNKAGMNVVVAPIEDIYNEFSYGIADAGAVKQFLGYAYHHWSTPEPKYVLLAGDGTYDPKGNLSVPSDDILPVHLGPSSWLWTSMDNWFVLVNGQDQLIDMAVGRIAVTSDVELGGVVDKIISFETAVMATNSWEKRATLVADDDSASVFKNASNNKIATHLGGAGFFMTKVFLDDPSYSGTNGVAARTTITNNFSYGRFLFSFFGHGAVDFWATEQILRNVDVNILENSIYPIVAMFTCQTGVFQDPAKDCIGERLLKKSGRGAVGCFAPSILANQQYSEYVADGFSEELVSTGKVYLGDASVNAMYKLWSDGNAFREELRAYHLLGDPATLVKAE